MSNLQTMKYKTILAPNAPWPKVELPAPKVAPLIHLKKTVKLHLGGSLDYFADTHDQINSIKNGRVRDAVTGKFKKS